MLPQATRRLLLSVIGMLGVSAWACGGVTPKLQGYVPEEASDAAIHAGILQPDAGIPLEEPPPETDDAGPPPVEPVDAGPALQGPPYPIVLMHGMGGFNQLDNLPFTLSYFSGVQADLQAHGVQNVFVTITSPYDSSENRAKVLVPQLQAILQQTGAAKLNLIGHSQGGLDARILASPAGLNMGGVIASVTTVATPHRGTPVADLGMGALSPFPSFLTGPITSAFLQLLEDGVYPVQTNPNILAQGTEMTTKYMAQTFNPKYVDAPGVLYESYGGRTNLATGAGDCDGSRYPNDPSALDIPQVELGLTADYMTVLGVQSDGLVPVTSAKWGTFLQCVPADHLKEVGMFFQNGPDPVSGYDHLAFFRTLVARLQAEGY
jgi:triacylglycerol lipase